MSVGLKESTNRFNSVWRTFQVLAGVAAISAGLLLAQLGCASAGSGQEPSAGDTQSSDPAGAVLTVSGAKVHSNSIGGLVGVEVGQLPGPPTPPLTVPLKTAPRLPALPVAGPKAASEAFLVEAPAAAVAATGTLVLYDTTGTWGFLGEMYAEQTANLVSHFGTWKAEPVTSYTAGQMSAYAAVVYVGSTYGEPLPLAFLADVRAGTVPVLWMFDNIWQLTPEYPNFATTMGWMWTGFDFSAISGVTYKATTLARDPLNNASGLMGTSVTTATVLASAVRSDGTTLPWAVRSGNLTYIGDIPFSYEGMSDRYLIFADLLYDLLKPTAATRHRALVRIEDVGPDASPTQLKAVADVLAARSVPFSIATFPAYRDPNGYYNNGKAQSYDLASKANVVSAIKYMQTKGGTVIMHGYTHQYSNVNNPYSGVSGDDCEFYLANVNSANSVVFTTPVPGDSTTWAAGRVTSGLAAFKAAGLAAPTIFETPHYAASAADYPAFVAAFAKRYERVFYFPGLLSGTAPDYTRINGQFFPYLVKDLYGSPVIPENLGNVEPVPVNNNPARLPADILASGKCNLVIRDGVASFFYHPYLGTAYLTQVVDGLKAQGWTFVAASSVVD